MTPRRRAPRAAPPPRDAGPGGRRPPPRGPRAAAAGALLALLAACGFEPALTGAPAPAPRLAEPGTRLDFLYRAAVEDRLGPGAPGAPLLAWTVAAEEEVVAVTAAESARRVQVVGAADWTLSDPAGRPLASGREEGFTSWSATGTTVSRRAARRDAEERLMRLLADRTVARLTALGLR